LYEGRAVVSPCPTDDASGSHGLASFLLTVIVDDVSCPGWNATVVGTTPGAVLVGRDVRVRLLDTPGRRATALARVKGTHHLVGCVAFS
jgi:hypothetical protein